MILVGTCSFSTLVTGGSAGATLGFASGVTDLRTAGDVISVTGSSSLAFCALVLIPDVCGRLVQRLNNSASKVAIRSSVDNWYVARGGSIVKVLGGVVIV